VLSLPVFFSRAQSCALCQNLRLPSFSFSDCPSSPAAPGLRCASGHTSPCDPFFVFLFFLSSVHSVRTEGGILFVPSAHPANPTSLLFSCIESCYRVPPRHLSLTAIPPVPAPTGSLLPKTLIQRRRILPRSILTGFIFSFFCKFPG